MKKFEVITTQGKEFIEADYERVIYNGATLEFVQVLRRDKLNAPVDTKSIIEFSMHNVISWREE